MGWFSVMNVSRCRGFVLLLSFGMLLYGLFRSTPPLPVLAHYDKAVHFMAFAVVTAIIPITFSRRLYRYSGVTVVIILAVMSEFIQANWLPYRHFGIQDMEANIAGVASILLLLLLCFWFRSSR